MNRGIAEFRAVENEDAELNVPFNKPYLTGKELAYIADVLSARSLAGDGAYTRRCNAWFEDQIGCPTALLTHSCTAALEMAALLVDLQPGDEVLMPSFTFSSTANAFVLRGVLPVFVDIRPDTLNIDEAKLEAAISPRTRAIVVVHYAGVGCEMDKILEIAKRHDLVVIEDAAQAVLSYYKGRPLGSIGELAAFSFHETKNVTSGEGGAFMVNDPRYSERAEILWQKGTDRSKFDRGEIDRYRWIDVGSSYAPAEIVSACLWAQLEQAHGIIERRRRIWDTYFEAFAPLERAGKVRRPIVPDYCTHNAHIFYLLLPNPSARTAFLSGLRARGIKSVFHYVPLGTAPAGQRFGREAGALPVTAAMSARLVRLPVWLGIEEHLPRIVEEAALVLEAL